jgi:hypothetical protein
MEFLLIPADHPRMRILRTNFDRAEMRREHRHPLPVFEVTIDGERFRSLNWSLGGVLVEGFYRREGSRVNGAIGLPGTRAVMLFSAAVVRADFDAAQCALQFDKLGETGVDFLDRAVARHLH